MKALYAPAQGEYGLFDRPRPVPAANEALVKVGMAALCHTDVDIRSGNVGHVLYPVIPGHEFAGVVEELGSECMHIKVGDKVAVHTIISCGECTGCRKGDVCACENYDEIGARRDGGFAEYCAIPARHLHRIPDHVALEDASLAEPLANAVCAVRTSRLIEGERVVVIGPGPIGLLAVQVARLANPSELILVGTRDERLALGNQFGATHLINIKQDGGIDALKQVLGPKGADVVIECSGTASALQLAIDIIGWRGRIALEGTPDMDHLATFSPFHLLHCKAVSMMGVCGWLTPDFVRALELIASGNVDVKPLITHKFALEEWEQAFEMITTRKSEAIKVVFDF